MIISPLLVMLGVGCTEDTVKEDTATTEAAPDEYLVTSAFDLPEQSSEISIARRDDGTVLWSQEYDTDLLMMDSQMSPAGNSLFYFLNDGMGHDGSRSVIQEIDSAGDVLDEIATPDGHHSFDVFEAEDGSQVISYVKAIVRNDSEFGDLVGDTVVEIDEDGAEHEVLNTFDVLVPAEPETGWMSGFYDEGRDWTHVNHLRWNAERGAYIMSLAEQNAVWEFDRNGRMTAVYLGQYGDRSLYEEGDAFVENSYPIYTGGDFSYQHAPVFNQDGELWLFSNFKDLSEESRAVCYSLNESERTLVEKERILPDDSGAHAAVLGGVLEFGDGSVLVNWGMLGSVESLDEDGDEIWSRDFGIGVIPSHVTPTDDVSDFIP